MKSAGLKAVPAEKTDTRRICTRTIIHTQIGRNLLFEPFVCFKTAFATTTRLGGNYIYFLASCRKLEHHAVLGNDRARGKIPGEDLSEQRI